jgi:formylglycine-generating enzyme required for sulfatase activity/predicted Ser/Thr protein kinase
MEKLGRYEIITELGRGNFATVYRALDTRLEREIALKVLNPLLSSQPDFKALFKREARTAARLRHAHIATIYDYDESQGHLYIAMEWIEGSDLRKLVRQQGPLPLPQVLTIIEHVADALACAHQQGLVHRDIKAANILLARDGRAVLTDFGLATAIAGSMYGQSMGGSMGITGTVEYLAPERLEGVAASPLSDLYSLGVVAYELLTGQVPFRADTPMAVMHMQANKLPPDPGKARPDLPEGIRTALLTALAKKPADRQPDVLAFASQLRQAGARMRAESEAKLAAARQQAEKLARDAAAKAEALKRQSQVAPQGENQIRLTLAPGVELELIRIPAGPFLMGSDKAKDKDAFGDELPQHQVELGEYWIGQTPLTNRQYQAYVQAAKVAVPIHWKNDKIPMGKEDHPVVNISLDDAVAFCEWLSRKTGQKLSLPSEAEWEKAARGGLPVSPPKSGGTEGGARLYPWGDQPPDEKRCNYDMNIKDTTPVGQYSPGGDSPYGCVDMAGNVWEWTRSLFKAYPYDADDGREGSQARDMRVLRGGSFYYNHRNVRCACRNGNGPNYRRDNLGFRVLLAPIAERSAANSEL